MSVPTTQRAIVIEGDKAVIKNNVPVPELLEGTALVKIEAVAGNPTDWKHIAFKIGPQGSILGCDLAGTIVKLGPNTTSDRFKVGDQLFIPVHGASVRHPENGAFAEYARVNLDLAFKGNLTHTNETDISEGKTQHFETAASLPVSLQTAGAVLFHHLGAKMEWKPSSTQFDHPVLIWGGSTAVGQQLIQVAKQTNIYTKIVVVASKKNEALLKSYGADDVFDYHDADVIEQIKSKYTNLVHVIDAVSSEESFVEAYKTTADGVPATLLQLTMLSIENIPKELRKDNVKIDGALLYCAMGEEVIFLNHTIPANPSYHRDVSDFVHFINPHIDSGEIRHMAVKVFPNGLEGVLELTEQIKAGKNRNVKLVARL